MKISNDEYTDYLLNISSEFSGTLIMIIGLKTKYKPNHPDYITGLACLCEKICFIQGLEVDDIGGIDVGEYLTRFTHGNKKIAYCLSKKGIEGNIDYLDVRNKCNYVSYYITEVLHRKIYLAKQDIGYAIDYILSKDLSKKDFAIPLIRGSYIPANWYDFKDYITLNPMDIFDIKDSPINDFLYENEDEDNIEH